MNGGIEIGMSRESEVQIPIFQNEAFLRRGWQIRIFPVFQSKSFLKVLFEKKPKGVQGRMQIFKYPIVSLLPDDPINEARKKVREGVEDQTLEGMLRPIPNCIYDVSHLSSRSPVAL